MIRSRRRRAATLLLAGSLVFGASAATAGARAGAYAASGTLRECGIPAPSLHLERRSVRVYLPPSYDRPGSAGRRYPVIILLHGSPGWNRDWLTGGHIPAILDRLIAGGRIPELIALMPDATGPGRGGRSLYINSYDGSRRMEDFITRDLLAWADSALRTQPRAASRALIGISEGAGAALNLAFRHPDLFGACGGHSGEYLLHAGPGLERILGPEPRASRLRAENSPVLYVERVAARLRGMRIYFDCGRLDFASLDDRELDRRLTALGVAHTYREFWGFHSWNCWRARLERSLVEVTRGMW